MGIDSGYGIGSLKTGVCTSTTRPAVPFDGQTISETDTDSLQVYKGTAWAPVSALTFISATTIGTTVSSVTVSSVFSATYDNYKVIISGGANTADASIALALGATTTGYYGGCGFVRYSDAASILRSDNNAAAWMRAGGADSSTLSLNLDIIQPFNAKKTLVFGTKVDSGTAGASGAMTGFLNNTTSYTAFTISVDAGTMTGGTIRVYGYSNS